MSALRRGALSAERVHHIGIPAQDIADVIAFAVSRAQGVALNEILVRPAAQAM
jgi:NADP-dependent 3-hydroxy acid dehydrogenase YdfG